MGRGESEENGDSEESDLEKVNVSEGGRIRRGRVCGPWDDSLLPVLSEEHCFAPETDAGLSIKMLHCTRKSRFQTAAAFIVSAPWR